MRVGKQQVVPVEGFSPAVGSRGQGEGKIRWRLRGRDSSRWQGHINGWAGNDGS